LRFGFDAFGGLLDMFEPQHGAHTLVLAAVTWKDRDETLSILIMSKRNRAELFQAGMPVPKSLSAVRLLV
jgi:hypothetical protein